MPQLTPPISGKSLPPTRPKAVEVAPPSRPKASAAPSDEDLRRVLDELEQTPIAFEQPDQGSNAERFIPLARFDDIVITIKMISNTVAHVRAVNEKLGHVETSTKTTIDDIGKTFEAMHTKLLALDEKLFQVK
jgi:aminoglycoside phosphotransferase (APT) family kinase protein